MKTVSIKLTSIESIRTLVDTASAYTNDIELSSGSYSIDAKSIMGIFGLDLSKPIELTVYGEDADNFIDKIKDIIV